MSIRLEDGWYVDENNNRWSCHYTLEQVETYSRTLRNCNNCIDCSYCSYCRDCVRCNYCCYGECCSDCSYCGHCDECNDCIRCAYSRRCTHCSDCSRCSYCNRCGYCNHCDCCDGFAVNPQRISGWTMGSRDDIPKVYWVKAGEEQCVVGCFRGTLNELEARVKETHKDNPKHLQDYLTFIKAVRAYQEACNDAAVL